MSNELRKRKRERESIDIEKTGSVFFNKSLQDKEISFEIIKFILNDFSDCNNISHKIRLTSKETYDIIFYNISRDIIQFNTLENIKNQDNVHVKDIFLYWKKNLTNNCFDIIISMKKYDSSKENEKEIESNDKKEIEEVITFRKKMEDIKPVNFPSTWQEDRFKIEDVVRKIYLYIEKKVEDIPALSFSIEFKNDSKKYVLGVLKIERISLSFVKKIGHQILFSCKNEPIMFITI